jgi:hypothetical protein
MKKNSLLILLILGSAFQMEAFSGKGSGTEKDPYQVTSADELFEIRNDLSASYKLMNSIDLGAFIAEDNPSQGWTPIGNVTTPFQGKFDGNNNVIKGLYINRPSIDNIGLFGCVENGYIRNLGLLNADVTGKDNVGALVGLLGFRNGMDSPEEGTKYNNRLSDVLVMGGSVVGENNVGGLVGSLSNIGQDFNTIPNTSLNRRKNYVSSIKGCTVYISVKASEDNAGGICGKIISGEYCVVSSYFSGWGNVYKAVLEDNSYIGKVLSQKNAGGIVSCSSGAKWNVNSFAYYFVMDYEMSRNVAGGVLSGNGNVGGIIASVNPDNFEINSEICVDNVALQDTISSKNSSLYRVSPKDYPNNYAYSGMLAYVNGTPQIVEDDEKNGQSYGLKTLKRKSTYEGMGFDFGTQWAIKEGESFPYNKNQCDIPEVTDFISGSRGYISGKASAPGMVYVFIGGNMYESFIVDGEWKVELGNITEGTEANVSVSADGKLPSSLVMAYAEKSIQTPSGKKGDANGDGVVDAADVVGIINYIIGKPSASFNALNADINGDGQVLVDDAVGAVELIMKEQ